MSYCRNCGNELAETAKFCDNCGTKVLVEQEDIEANQKKSKRNENSNGSIFDFIFVLLTIGVSIWVYDLYLGLSWVGKAATVLFLIYPQYIIGIILFIVASIRSIRSYRNLKSLKILAQTNLITVIGLHLLIFIFSLIYNENTSTLETLNLLIDLYLIAMIIFNIYVVIRYSFFAYKNGFKILIGR